MGGEYQLQLAALQGQVSQGSNMHSQEVQQLLIHLLHSPMPASVDSMRVAGAAHLVHSIHSRFTSHSHLIAPNSYPIHTPFTPHSHPIHRCVAGLLELLRTAGMWRASIRATGMSTSKL